MPDTAPETPDQLIRSLQSEPVRAIAPGRRDPVVWLIACGMLLVAAIIVGTIAMVNQFRERAMANGERELENTVLLLTRHFDQQFDDYRVLMGDLISRLDLDRYDSAAAFRADMSGLPAQRRLRAEVSILSYVDDINVFDDRGEIINSSGAWPPPRISIAGRGYFERFSSDPAAPPFLAEAHRSFYTGQWTTVLAHRLSNANGTFLGVMTRRISPANYTRFFESVALGRGAAISLLHGDGTLLARYPHAEDMIGRNLSRASLVSKVIATGRPQTLRMIDPLDGDRRIGAGRQLSRFPIVVVATRTVDAVLADWREQTRFMTIAAGLSASVVALILFLIIRQIVGQNREIRRSIEAQRQRLDTALNNMTQGLILFDANAGLVLCNERYIAMWGLAREIMKPGIRFEDVMRHRKEVGSFRGDVEDYCRTVMENVVRGVTVRKEVEAPDGRAFQIVNKPLAEGGWVATVEDITERRRLEQERDRNHAFLREIIDHIPSQITVKDVRDRRYLLINRVTETQFGTSRDAIVGRTAFDLFPDHAAQKITDDDERCLDSTAGLFIDEHVWISQALGPRYITSRRIAIRDPDDTPRYIINVVEDVTERRQASEKIAHLAHFDSLTDLPNRVQFREHLERELQKLRGGDAAFALLYIDIDEFKGINDSLGHHVGDEFLKCVAARLKGCLGPGDLIARLGGDEFAIIRTAIRDRHAAETFVASIYAALRSPYDCLGHQLSGDASIGIALAPHDGTEIDQLVKNADLAMYAAKTGGRRIHRFFEPEMDARARGRLSMERDLRQALATDGFVLHYQPLVDLRSNRISGCEALLRWHHPQRGLVSPAEFIPVAEDAGLIGEIGEWVLRTACREAAGWPDHIRLAVNVSPVQLKSPALALRIASALAASGLAPTRLEIEITEAVLIRDDEAALAILHQLKRIGVRIALDDFGTGYSSLSYLKRFPFDKIKIDRSFVADITEVASSSSIVAAVVSIAAALDMTTTAEGVETEAQRELLRSLGCNEMQGYLFSAPRPQAELRQLLGRGRIATAVA